MICRQELYEIQNHQLFICCILSCDASKDEAVRYRIAAKTVARMNAACNLTGCI
jgi:hypothetical protein